MLERLVGAVERNETPQPVGQVLATLPWVRLLVAEADPPRGRRRAAALFLVIPGLIVGTLFALVGPLINLLDCSVPEAFRRSLQLVWPHFLLVFVMVTHPAGGGARGGRLDPDLVPHERVCPRLPHQLRHGRSSSAWRWAWSRCRWPSGW